MSETGHERKWRPIATYKKAPDHAGAFELLKFSRDQYLATTGPVQLKR
jgi:hypothetical protein